MKNLLLLTAGILTGLAAYTVYTESSVLTAFAVVFLGALIAHSLRSLPKAWQSLKLLQQPYIVAFIALGLGFIYISMDGFSFLPSIYFSSGTALIGFAAGIFIYSIWNLR
ncbi:MAG: hypothetical protein ACLFTA_01580 [Candidatus Nanohaloarchaea archaeon]